MNTIWKNPLTFTRLNTEIEIYAESEYDMYEIVKCL